MKILYNNLEDKFSNIIPEDQMQEITKQTIEVISREVADTLGPYGYNKFIEEPQLGNFTTKDGFTVIQNLMFEGTVSKMILKLIRDVSRMLVEEVGDGSSTVTIAASKLYSTTMNLIKENNMRPKQATDILNELKDFCIDYIRNNSTSISEDLHELKDIATISLNNDENLGEIVSKAYISNGREGFVNVAIGKGENTTFETAKGFQLDYGFVDPILINNPELKESAYEKPIIIMLDAGLHSEKWTGILDALLGLSLSRKENIIIITSGYGKLIRNWFANYATTCRNNKIPITMSILEVPNSTDAQFAKFEDLAIKVGARIINTIDKEENNINFNPCNPDQSKISILEYAGTCDRIVSTKKTTTIINGGGNKEVIDTRISYLREELEKTKEDDVLVSTKYRLKKRLAVLTDKLTTIKVGGISEQSKINTKALVDDAVGACRSAIKSGYVKGNNITLISAMYEYIKQNKYPLHEQFAVALFQAVYEGYRLVRENGKIETLPMESLDDILKNAPEILNKNINIIEGSTVDVISPANTDIEIIKSITTMIGLLITTKGALIKQTKSSYTN